MIAGRNVNMRLNNNTFRGGPRTDLNACVGENGLQDNSIYSEGYLSAAKLLLDQLVPSKSLQHVDTVVFPIAFCVRHGIELHIKAAIEALPKIREIPDLAVEKLQSSHDIGILWAEFKEKAVDVDRRFVPLLEELDEYISDYAEVDPNGQTFRYPRGLESQKHLKRTPLINLERLSWRLERLIPLVKKLERLTLELQHEYAQGTFTKALSRADLELIAEDMPKWQLRDQPEFKQVKQKLMAELKISSRSFDQGLKLIKKHPVFAAQIGIEHHLKYLNSRELAFFIDCVDHLYPKSEEKKGPSIVSAKEISFEEVIADLKRTATLVKECCRRIQPHSMAEIGAIYYLGRDGQYAEEYPKWLKMQLFDIEHQSFSKSRYFDFTEHFLSKTNARQCIEKGLERVGQYRLLVNMDHMDSRM